MFWLVITMHVYTAFSPPPLQKADDTHTVEFSSKQKDKEKGWSYQRFIFPHGKILVWDPHRISQLLVKFGRCFRSMNATPWHSVLLNNVFRSIQVSTFLFMFWNQQVLINDLCVPSIIRRFEDINHVSLLFGQCTLAISMA